MNSRLEKYLSRKLDRLRRLEKIVKNKPTVMRVITVRKESERWFLAAVEFAVEGEFNYVEEGILFKNSFENPTAVIRRWIKNIENQMAEEIHYEDKGDRDIPL